MEAWSECVHFAHAFLARLAPICMLSRCLLTKFLHRSSVGNLSRVRCWLGSAKIVMGKGNANELRMEGEEKNQVGSSYYLFGPNCSGA